MLPHRITNMFAHATLSLGTAPGAINTAALFFLQWDGIKAPTYYQGWTLGADCNFTRNVVATAVNTGAIHPLHSTSSPTSRVVT